MVTLLSRPITSLVPRLFSNRIYSTVGRKEGLVPIAWVIVRMRFKLPRISKIWVIVLRT